MTFLLKKLILVKFHYLVLDAKLLINHVESFFSSKNLDTKNLTKLFTIVDVADW